MYLQVVDVGIDTLGFQTRQKRRVHFETRGFKRKPEVFKNHEISKFMKFMKNRLNQQIHLKPGRPPLWPKFFAPFCVHCAQFDPWPE